MRIFSLLLSLIFLSCAVKEQATTLLWTDEAGIIEAVEQFNKANPDMFITAEYRKNAGEDFFSRQKKCDLIIAKGLNSPALTQHLEPFNIETGMDLGIYKEFLKTGIIGGDLKLLPLSFDLPVILYDRDRHPEYDDMVTIDLMRLKELSLAYNGWRGKSYFRCGFDPGAEPDFLFSFLQPGTAWITREGNYELSREAWKQWSGYFALWRKQTALSAWSAFEKKYGYIHPLKRLESGNILFYPSTLSKLYSLPYNERSHYGIIYPQTEGQVRTTENSIYAGIWDQAPNRSEARAFLTWYFSDQTQKDLSPASRDYTLSSVAAVNDPSLSGQPYPYPLPPESRIAFTSPKPVWYEDYKAEILTEFRDVLYSEEISFEELSEKHNLWTGLNRLEAGK